MLFDPVEEPLRPWRILQCHLLPEGFLGIGLSRCDIRCAGWRLGYSNVFLVEDFDRADIARRRRNGGILHNPNCSSVVVGFFHEEKEEYKGNAEEYGEPVEYPLVSLSVVDEAAHDRSEIAAAS